MTMYEQFAKNLRAKYGKSSLTINETATELSRSVNSIRLGVKAGRGIPRYKKVGSGIERQTIIFPILEVARFLASTDEVY